MTDEQLQELTERARQVLELVPLPIAATDDTTRMMWNICKDLVKQQQPEATPCF